MGAEGWTYFAPYEKDVAQAITKYKKEILESCDWPDVKISEEAENCALAPVPKENLLEWLGTDKPTKEMIDDTTDLWDYIERGQGHYIFIYDDDDKPVEICFMGYTLD